MRQKVAQRDQVQNQGLVKDYSDCEVKLVRHVLDTEDWLLEIQNFFQCGETLERFLDGVHSYGDAFHISFY